MAECELHGTLKNGASGEAPVVKKAYGDAATGAPRCHLPMAECQPRGMLKNSASGEGPWGEEGIW